MEIRGRDQYGRVLAVVEVDGRPVNESMVADGMAWHYARYSKDAGLAAAQRDAQAAKRGLWADDYPVPPWGWRASEKDRKGVPAGR